MVEVGYRLLSMILELMGIVELKSAGCMLA